jgi:hypothetical protein
MRGEEKKGTGWLGRWVVFHLELEDEVTRSFGIKRLVTLESIQSRGKIISCSIRFSKSKRTFSNVTESIGISNRKVNI